ncbi:MAG: Peptidylprolyl isomerase [Massilia sp.]|nr:Peptidylprolyl isomerase [Massilia sp.]
MQALTNLTPEPVVHQPHHHLLDARGYAMSGASPAAIDAWELALANYLGWRSGAEIALSRALQEAPGFVMARVLQAYILLCSRDPRRVQAARPVLAGAATLPANERERMHLAAIGATLGDDYEHAMALLGNLLRRYPRDALALQVAHAFDYITGNVVRLRQRVAAVLPSWSRGLPGYHAVLAMHAFGLVESGEYDLAEETAGAALELSAAPSESDARAHHVMAHVFEMTKRPAEGVRWMNGHRGGWGVDTVVATHCWWHLGLFHLTLRDLDGALAIYDGRIRAAGAIADLIDASALLWRVQLLGGAAGARWSELAAAWAPHVDDGFCSFNDLHAMLAFVGARDWDSASRLERELATRQSLPTRHGETTRQIGLPACRALIAFGQGNDTLALALLAGLPALAHHFGGSHAQRDVLHMTMLAAIERLRRPRRSLPAADVGRFPATWRRHHDDRASDPRPRIGAPGLMGRAAFGRAVTRGRTPALVL